MNQTIVRIATEIVQILFIFQKITATLLMYLIEEKGLSQATAVGLFALLFVSGAVFQISAGRAADLVGIRRMLLFFDALGILT
jgi:MFS family permease